MSLILICSRLKFHCQIVNTALSFISTRVGLVKRTFVHIYFTDLLFHWYDQMQMVCFVITVQDIFIVCAMYCCKTSFWRSDQRCQEVGVGAAIPDVTLFPPEWVLKRAVTRVPF